MRNGYGAIPHSADSSLLRGSADDPMIRAVDEHVNVAQVDEAIIRNYAFMISSQRARRRIVRPFSDHRLSL